MCAVARGRLHLLADARQFLVQLPQGFGLRRQPLGEKLAPSSQFLGPLHMPLEAKGFRHRTVALAVVAVACLVIARPRQ